jgi:hypothetical protein
MTHLKRSLKISLSGQGEKAFPNAPGAEKIRFQIGIATIAIRKLSVPKSRDRFRGEKSECIQCEPGNKSSFAEVQNGKRSVAHPVGDEKIRDHGKESGKIRVGMIPTRGRYGYQRLDFMRRALAGDHLGERRGNVPRVPRGVIDLRSHGSSGPPGRGRIIAIVSIKASITPKYNRRELRCRSR